MAIARMTRRIGVRTTQVIGNTSSTGRPADRPTGPLRSDRIGAFSKRPAGRCPGSRLAPTDAQNVGMTRYVALLRGINVGGRKKVAMGDLRGVLSGLGYEDVETLLQSGNALFTAAPKRNTDALGRQIEEALERDLDMEVRVLVRTPADLAEVVEANPFPDAISEPSKLHVAFLSATPGAGKVAELDPARFQPDELQVSERAVYLWYPNGAGRSKLTNDVLERKLGVTATTRNWNTVLKLLEKASAGS